MLTPISPPHFLFMYLFMTSGDVGSSLGSGRSPGEENGYPLQYSCLGNPMDRGAWQVIVHGVAESQTRLGGEAHSPPNFPSKLAYNTEKHTLYFNHEKEKIKGNSRR